MIQVLTIVLLGYAAYSDKKSLTVHPAVTMSVLLIWICCRIHQLIYSMDTFRYGKPENILYYVIIPVLTFLIAALYAMVFHLGWADVVWMTIISLLFPHAGIVIVITAMAGFLLFLLLTKEQGQNSPVIPFLFAAAISFLAVYHLPAI